MIDIQEEKEQKEKRRDKKEGPKGIKSMRAGGSCGKAKPTFYCENCKQKRHNPCGCQKKGETNAA